MNDKYPATPGYTGDQGTSKAAAEKVSSRAPSIRFRVWDALVTVGAMTGEEMADHLTENLYSVLPRLTEMQHAGMVRDSGVRGKTKLGGDTVIWERVPGAVYADKIEAVAAPRKTNSAGRALLDQAARVCGDMAVLVGEVAKPTDFQKQTLDNAREFLRAYHAWKSTQKTGGSND